MALKYGAELERLSACPPAGALEQDRPGWRYVFVPLKADSFVPIALKGSPPVSSSKSGTRKVRKVTCSAWGLSMYDTAEQASAKIVHLIATIPNIKARVGTHLAYGALTKACGLSTPSNIHGHFDLHPYDGIAFENIFVVQGALP